MKSKWHKYKEIHNHIIVKMLNVPNKEKILKEVMGKGLFTSNRIQIQLTVDFSGEIIEARSGG